MLEVTKKHHTNKSSIKIILDISVDNTKLEVSKKEREALLTIINSIVDSHILSSKKYSAEETFGRDLTDEKRRIGVLVKVKREDMGMTQNELAGKIGMDQPNLSACERGERGFPKKFHSKLCKILKVKANRFEPRKKGI